MNLEQRESLEKINNMNKKFNVHVLQGTTGSGKTIVSLLVISNTIESGYQCAMMAPTEILARQHYNLAKKIFLETKKIEIISGKSEYKEKKEILKNLENNKIDIIFGTHAIFQKKVSFNKLGLIIIDEQHKFGVNQRKKLSDKEKNSYYLTKSQILFDLDTKKQIE